MNIDPDLVSFLKWATGGLGTVLAALAALAGKGLSAILNMQKETVQACVNQANSNEKVAKALEQLPCAMHQRSEHTRGSPSGFLTAFDPRGEKNS